MRMKKLIAGALLALLIAGCPAAAPDAAPAMTATLAWTGDADLDLELWSDTGAYLGDANDWGNRSEGAAGEEFVFRAYTAAEDLRGGKGADFARGAYRLAVTVWRADQPCTAILTMRMPGKPSQDIAVPLPAQTSQVAQIARWDNETQVLTALDTMAMVPLLPIQ